MLVLTRKRDQSICIRDDVVVKVLEIHGNRVRLGIEAPATTNIRRAELIPASVAAQFLADRFVDSSVEAR
jgi:carbon storage regulator